MVHHVTSCISKKRMDCNAPEQHENTACLELV